MRRFFYKALSKVIIQVGVLLFVLPLIGLGLFCLGEWLVTGHWIRVTLCTASYAFDDLRDGPSLETYEFILCPINTGLAGIDLILNCFINELSLFGTVPIISVIGLVITVHLWARCVLAETAFTPEPDPAQ